MIPNLISRYRKFAGPTSSSPTSSTRRGRTVTSSTVTRTAAIAAAVIAASCVLTFAVEPGVAWAAARSTGQQALAPALDRDTTTSVLVSTKAATSLVSSGPARATAIDPAKTITCKLAVQHPHKSSHVPGTVNVVATISCTAAVRHLDMNAGLYYKGKLVSTGHKQASNSASLQANAAVDCRSGKYAGGATGAVTFPAGYVPPTSDFGGQVWSPEVSITC